MNINNPVAVIDLGSNTFHILIAKFDGTTINEIYRKRVFVGLAEGGIKKIKPSKIKLGLDTLIDFRQKLDDFNCSIIKVIGTSALRSASNSHSFVEPANKILTQNIEVIDGLQEAQFIFDGVSLITEMEEDSLIMDIGGGSTEFIIVRNNQIQWRRSYKLGVGVLYANFHKSEPINQIDTNNLLQHINDTLIDLKAELQMFNIKQLIGASGSFEVLETMMGKDIKRHKVSKISLSDFMHVYSVIVTSNIGERKIIKGLPIDRVKLIVVAMILIAEILVISHPDQIILSPYALKEGVLKKMNK